MEKAHENAAPDLEFLRLDAVSFGESPAISVDHAVMERSSNAWVVPLDAGWRDVGSWASLAALSPRDGAGNAVRGDAVVQGTRNTFIRGDARLVAAIGVTDLVIVEAGEPPAVPGKAPGGGVPGIAGVAPASGRQAHR